MIVSLIYQQGADASLSDGECKHANLKIAVTLSH